MLYDGRGALPEHVPWSTASGRRRVTDAIRLESGEGRVPDTEQSTQLTAKSVGTKGVP